MSVTKRQLGKYDLIGRIGRGGMAEVFKANQASLDRFVAIKLLHPFLADDPEFKDRFEREARNVARLKHPNIVQVYDFEYDVETESYYMVMELIEGHTLKEQLEKSGDQRMPMSEILRIMRYALEALAYAHGRGMIHRDLKPANLMLENDGRVVLTDFGIAKIVTGNQFTASGGMVGTPAYMSPEQGLGEIADERCDVYSMGVILFQMTTGKLPYDGETPLATVLKHMNDPIPSPQAINPTIPDAIDKIIRKAMAKTPEERYQTADEMLQDINAVANGDKPVNVDNIAKKRTTASTAAIETPILTSGALKEQIAEHNTNTAATTMPKQTRRTGWLVGSVIGLLVIGFTFITMQTGRIPIFNIPLNPSATPSMSETVATQTSFVSTPTDSPLLPPTEVGTSTTPPATTIVALVATDPPTETTSPTETFTVTPSSTATFTSTFTATASSTATATFTTTPSATATYTNTPTVTFTQTPSSTATASNTATATITATPSRTFTPTVDITLTLQGATVTSIFKTQAALEAVIATQRANLTPTADYTQTAQVCRFDFKLISPVGEIDPRNSQDIRVKKRGSNVELDIVIRNDGDCDWTPGVYLSYVDKSGERFDSPTKIVSEETAENKTITPGETVLFKFKGKAITDKPTTRGLTTGKWEVRLSDSKLIGTIDISLWVYGD
jgi:serine/threonine protein kinase